MVFSLKELFGSVYVSDREKERGMRKVSIGTQDELNVIGWL